MQATTASVVFSDLDGTLVHYPKHFSSYAQVIDEDDQNQLATVRYRHGGETRRCAVLTSLTGGKAYLSLRTKQLVCRLRELGVMFVIITGARASTYAARRAQLPAADFEFFENGGRKLRNGVLDASWSDKFAPQVGRIHDRTSLVPRLATPDARDGSLWRVHGELVARGWTTDTRDYSTNFRVDVGGSAERTAAALGAALQESGAEGAGLTSSYNLGKADVYPAGSGKANAARGVLRELGESASDAVALFDDDNDVLLGELCGRAFLPGVTHDSVAKALERHAHWELASRRGVLGTEEVLERVIGLREAALQATETR
ncbi:unnamed protein product [Agarophyton chilense]